LIDLEGSLNAQMARGSGIDIERLHLAQPESGEQVLELCEMLIDADDVAVVGIDSIAGMTPAAVIAGDYGDSHVGVQARMLSQGLSKLKSQIRLKKPRAAFIFTNQIRYKIGQMGYGDPTTTPGGEAMKFYPDVRLDVRKGEWRKETGAEEPWGHELKVKTVKNRLAPPLRVAHLDMVYGRGISNSSSLVDLAERLGIVKKSGAWYAWVSTGESIGQGRTKAILRLDEDEELRNAIAEETSRAYRGVDSAESD
jgi:recombination protein RecA